MSAIVIRKNHLIKSHFTSPWLVLVPGHARLILRRKDSGNLLTLTHIRELCSLDRALRRVPEFHQLAERTPAGKMCRTWNLPNYLTVLAGRTSCHHLTEPDIQTVANLTARCLPFFRRGRLKECYADEMASSSR